MLAAALALGVALAGCGSAKPLTRAQLVSDANGICARIHAEIKKQGLANTPQQFAHLVRKLAGFEQQQLEAMRKLKPPSSLASDWKHMLEGAEEVAEDAGNLSTDVQLKKEKTSREALTGILHVQQRLSPIAARDGFTNCKELT